jgi:hypothetical protein
VGRVAAQTGERLQGVYPQATRFPHDRLAGPEGDQLAIDLPGERAGQFQGVALSATQQTVHAE